MKNKKVFEAQALLEVQKFLVCRARPVQYGRQPPVAKGSETLTLSGYSRFSNTWLIIKRNTLFGPQALPTEVLSVMALLSIYYTL